MQAVILAAGNSSRFIPFTHSFAHKSLVIIMGKTVLEHTIDALIASGITEIILVVNKKEPFEKVLAGRNYASSITYVLLSEALGMGAALLAAKEYIHDSFFLLNANHIEAGHFIDAMKKKQTAQETIVLLGKKDTGYDRYGYLQYEGDRIFGVIEKPKQPIPSSLRIIGIYLLTRQFVDILAKTPQDHYNFELALDAYSKRYQATFVETEEKTVTLKYGWDLFYIKDYLLVHMEAKISPNATIAKNAQIIGKVFIAEGATIMEGVCIKGPAYIGENAFIGSNSLIRNGTVVEKNAVVGSYMEMKNVLLMESSTTHTGVVEDSIIGAHCRIAGGIITANVRLDRETIKTTVKDERIDTKLHNFGILLGNNANLGVRVTTMPGIIIGKNVLVGPSTTVMKNLPDNTKYYTKFSDIVEEEIKK